MYTSSYANLPDVIMFKLSVLSDVFDSKQKLLFCVTIRILTQKTLWEKNCLPVLVRAHN